MRVLLLILFLLPSAVWASEVTVFAAASLKTALQKVANEWKNSTGHSATLSFAGSSALARQIQAGAPADIFLSANTGWMDHLEQQHLIRPETRFDLLGNTLVLIGPAHADPIPLSRLPEKLQQGPLAMALTDAVPAGIYGKAALQSLGLWSDVETRVAQADNVRAALALVALGEAPFGITYGSDAMADPRVTVVARIPATAHPAIVYPVAQTIDSTHPLALDFLSFLKTPQARAIFLAKGFSMSGRP